MADRRCIVNRFSAPLCLGVGLLIACVQLLGLPGCGSEPGQKASPSQAERRPQNAVGEAAGLNPSINTHTQEPTSATQQPSTPSQPAPFSPALDTTIAATIAGEAFELEVAADNATRFRGLGGRASLPDRRGMIFAFPFSERLEFVMRDCLMDIDIAYLDNDGVVLTLHEMVIEPRDEDEADADYERRLVRYPSRFPARFAVEVRGGLFRELGVQVGDVIVFDGAALKKQAR